MFGSFIFNPLEFEIDGTKLVRYSGNNIDVTIPSGVETIGVEAFEGTDVERVILPDSVITIKYGAFKNCKKLRKIELPETLTDIEAEAFLDCENLLSVKIPDNIKIIKESTFSGNSSLNTVVLGKNIVEIGEKAFAWCINLTEIDLPEKLSTLNFASFGWTGLKKIVTPPSLEYISDSAFNNTEIEHIVISEGCRGIGYRAFYCGDSITERHIYLPSTILSIEYSAFNVYSGKNIIHSPINSSIIAFCSATNAEWVLDLENPKTIKELIENIKKKNGVTETDIIKHKQDLLEFKNQVSISSNKKLAYENSKNEIQQTINNLSGFLKFVKIKRQNKLLEETKANIRDLEQVIISTNNKILKIEAIINQGQHLLENITTEQLLTSANQIIEYLKPNIKRYTSKYIDEMDKAKKYEDIVLTSDIVERITHAAQKAINSYEPTQLPDFVSIPTIDVSDM